MVEIMEFIIGFLGFVACFWGAFMMTEIIREEVETLIMLYVPPGTYNYKKTKAVVVPASGIETDKEIFISSFLGGLLEYIRLFPEEHDQMEGKYSPRELTLGPAEETLTAMVTYEETVGGLVFWDPTLIPMKIMVKKGQFPAEKTVAF